MRFLVVRSFSTTPQSRGSPYLGNGRVTTQPEYETNAWGGLGKSHKHDVSLDTLSPIGSKVHQRLASKKEHPAAILRDLTATHAITALPVDAILIPLRELVRRFSGVHQNVRKKEVLREPMAAALLQYLWAHQDLWWNFTCRAHNELALLSLYAEIEGFGHFIVDWLQIPVPEHDYSSSSPEMSNWRGFLLRTIVSARLACGEDQSADKALQTFFEVNAAKLAAKHDGQSSAGDVPLFRLSIKPAMIELTSALSSRRFLGTRADLYDRFVRLHGNYGGMTPIEKDFAQAQLALAHPTRPSCRPALETIDTHFSQLDSRKLVVAWFAESKGRFKFPFRLFFLRTAAQLRSEGDHTGANRVAERYRQLTDETLNFENHQTNIRRSHRPSTIREHKFQPRRCYATRSFFSTSSRSQYRPRPFLGKELPAVDAFGKPSFEHNKSFKRTVALDNLSREASDVRDRLKSKQEHPAAILRDLTTSKTALPIDALLLPIHQLGSDLAVMRRADWKEHLLREPIAAALLRYLWSHEALWRKFACNAHDESQTLAIFAESEGLGSYLVDWLRVNESPRDADAVTIADNRWRGYLLRSIVRAQLLCNEHESADKALRTFFDVNDAKLGFRHGRRTSSGDPALSMLSIKPVVIELSSALHSNRYRRTRVDYFETFIKIRESNRGFPEGPTNISGPLLALSHPTKPSAKKALEFIEKHFPSETSGDLASEWRSQTAGSSFKDLLRLLFMRTADQLRCEGDDATADKIIAKYQSLTATLGLIYKHIDTGPHVSAGVRSVLSARRIEKKAGAARPSRKS